MRKPKFTDVQMVAILKEADAGRPDNEIWQHDGIGSITYNKWQAKYGWLNRPDVKGLKDRATRLNRYTHALLRECGIEGVNAKIL